MYNLFSNSTCVCVCVFINGSWGQDLDNIIQEFFVLVLQLFCDSEITLKFKN